MWTVVEDVVCQVIFFVINCFPDISNPGYLQHFRLALGRSRCWGLTVIRMTSMSGKNNTKLTIFDSFLLSVRKLVFDQNKLVTLVNTLILTHKKLLNVFRQKRKMGQSLRTVVSKRGSIVISLLLTQFQPMFNFYSPSKHQEISTYIQAVYKWNIGWKWVKSFFK